MPTYEFRCLNCQQNISLVYKNVAAYAAATPACSHCQSEQLRRVIGRVAVLKSEDSRMSSMPDEAALAGLDAEDPKALGQYMRTMSQEMGEDMGPEFNEVVGRLEKGQSPDEIEKAMPELAAEPPSTPG